MHLEAFTEAKDPRAPETNEDSILLLPGRAVAVIDGVSDRTGHCYDGMLAGRFASRLVCRRLQEMLGGGADISDPDWPDPARIVGELTAAIADAYRRFGTLEQVRAHWGGRIATTLALVTLTGETVQAVLVGDSGVRVNGAVPLRLDKDLDRITATLRRHAWHAAAARTQDAERREFVARRVAFMGAGQAPDAVAPTLDGDDLAAIGARSVAACVAALPHVSETEIALLVQEGIVNGQGRYQNSTRSVLGYSCLDGFAVPPSLMRVARWPRAEVRTVELYTDGYFRAGDGFGIAAWEAAFAAVEREDPRKLGEYLSPRGSIGGNWADDRSYVGLRLA